ncbi:pyrroline-5-carboxylate reductase 3 isoform X1 [Neopsephotus bourkii]|uniref:pyrroline-5-carboxylate reductase 3 isoform X1 n=1 Tax=Neopsephotus bourkii TaxID=309878 RepID=UPI002AA59D16|nr:pyrroline-5-carboxylate reductase 3 isoform X1 [Neopsephotus bourkii]XP_061303572.1 pyrroline-5-carboxylate reductase 3 isoform X1 [Pezoporus flaviventris]
MEAAELRVGFVGAGRMAGGLARGLLRAGKVPASSILASAPSDKNLDAWRAVTPLPVHGQESGCRTTHCNLEVLQESTLVILATKPHVLPGVLQEIRPAVGPHHIVVSLVAGVTLQTLQRLLPSGTKVLRLMPNLPCVVQAGAMVFARGSGAGDEEASLLKNLLSSCGLCEEVPESYINIHTGLSGSGVAYVYLFAEALAEGAVKMGMPGGLASRIAAQTLLGAAKMMLETGEHPAKLRGDVCTPGGTTIHALHQLEKGALRATVMNAVEAATNRARSMAED